MTEIDLDMVTEILLPTGWMDVHAVQIMTDAMFMWSRDEGNARGQQLPRELWLMCETPENQTIIIPVNKVLAFKY